MSIAALRQGIYPGSQIVIDKELAAGLNYRIRFHGSTCRLGYFQIGLKNIDFRRGKVNSAFYGGSFRLDPVSTYVQKVQARQGGISSIKLAVLF
jgi:hypothetical protein